MVLERLREFAVTGGAPGADFECRGCGSRYEVQRQVCPDCGGFSIERTDW